MKFSTLVSICFLVFGGLSSVNAQLALVGYGGYTFADKFQADIVTGRLEDAGHWGAAIEYFTSPFTAVELYYRRIDQDITYRFLGFENGRIPAYVNYIMVGGSRYLPANDKIWPYGGGSLGIAIVGTELAEDTRFAWGFKLGTLLLPQSKVGIKLQADIHSIVQGVGGGLYIGTGGSGVNVNTYSSIYQFGFTGGLLIRLGDMPSSSQAPGRRF